MEPIAVLGVIAWLAAGWLPSRILKHYFCIRFAALGPAAWTARDERFSTTAALGGPFVGVADIYYRWQLGRDEHIPWGWRW